MTNPWVSARAAVGLLKTMSAEGHDLAPVFDGLPFTRADLDAWTRRIHWNDYVELFERLHARLGDETFYRLADGYSEAYPEFRAFAGAVVSPARFARVISLLSASTFPMMRYRCDITDERFINEVWLDDPSLRPSELFFRASGPAWVALPCHLGYPRATVEAQWTDRWSRVVLPLPKSRALPSWVRAEVTRRGGDALKLFAEVVGDVTQAFELLSASPLPAQPASERDDEVARSWRLTPRESEVLSLIVEGRSNKEIAAALDCSVRTVEIHVSKILAKSGCASRAEVSAAYWRSR